MDNLTAPPRRRRFDHAPVRVETRSPSTDRTPAVLIDALREELRQEREERQALARTVQEMQATIRALVTRLAHAELAQAEAVEKLRAEMEQYRATARPEPQAEAEGDQPVEWWKPGWQSR